MGKLATPIGERRRMIDLFALGVEAQRCATEHPRRREVPRQVPGSAIRDALTKGTYSGNVLAMSASSGPCALPRCDGGSVAGLKVHHLDRGRGLRNVPVKGEKTRDIPLASAVMQYLDRYATQHLSTEVQKCIIPNPRSG